MQIKIFMKFNVSSNFYVNCNSIHTSIPTSAICEICFSCDKKHLWSNIDKFPSTRSSSTAYALLQKILSQHSENTVALSFCASKEVRINFWAHCTALFSNYHSFSIHKSHLILIFNTSRNQTPSSKFPQNYEDCYTSPVFSFSN